jgi:PAS domain S-box-containing protein
MNQNEYSDIEARSHSAGAEDYRRLFEQAIEGICLADQETGIILDCNQAFLRLTGYERSELIGRPQTMLHPAEDGNPLVTRKYTLARSEMQGKVIHDLLVTKSGAVKEVEVKAGPIEIGGRQLMHGFFRDLTEELRGRRERETSLALMRLLNECSNSRELIRNLTVFLRTWSNCEAVGIRLREGDDFPYFETRGFPGEFVEAENYFCQRDQKGQLMCDNLGTSLLECMCGNILCGRFNPALPFFTSKGSFWTNCTTELLASITGADRQASMRNRCNTAGYESVALIPLRHGDRILGLLQLNDHARGRFTPELIFFLENLADQIAIALAQRQTQEALEASEKRYRGLFENMTESYAYHRMIFENGEPRDYIFLSVNESFETMTGLKNVVGKKVTEVIPGIRESNPELFATYGRAATTGKPEKIEMYVEALKSWYHVSVYSPEKEFFVTVFDNITERKNAETALRKSVTLFSKAFHGSPVAMTISSMRDQRIIDVNDAFERQSGYERGEVIGRTPLESMNIVHRGEVDRLTKILIAEGNIRNQESPFRTRSGEQRLALFSAEIVEIADEPCILTVAEDITDRKRAVEALQFSEARFRLLFDNMSNGMYVYEALEDGADFIIKELNPAAERIGKANRAAVVGRRVSQAFPALTDIVLFQVFQRVWRSGIPERHPASFYMDDRLSVWVENYVFKLPSGEVVAIIDDITERKRAEAELRKSEIWHRSLIELGVSVYIVLDEKRQIHYASPLVEKVLGWTPADFLHKSFFEFVASVDAESAARFFTEILQAPRRKKRMHAYIRCKNGDRKALEFFGINLLDEPAVRGIVLSSHDITEQVHAQERVDAFRAELTHASRLAAMGALTAGIAHEINQPLAVMATWAEVASREIRDNLTGDKQEAILALMRIGAAMKRSGDIIQRMKDFARKSEPRVTKVSIAEAIKEVQSFLDHQLRVTGVTLSFEADHPIPPASADRTQVQQVLMNLILNAIEAMKSSELEARRVEIRAKAGEDMLEVAVSDSGCSIPHDELESIFDPFRSSKPKGLGLGLSICRTIIQWHGGRIWAARNADRGSTVTFTLPIAKEKHRHATETDHLHRGRRTRSS